MNSLRAAWKVGRREHVNTVRTLLRPKWNARWVSVSVSSVGSYASHSTDELCDTRLVLSSTARRQAHVVAAHGSPYPTKSTTPKRRASGLRNTLACVGKSREPHALIPQFEPSTERQRDTSVDNEPVDSIGIASATT